MGIFVKNFPMERKPHGENMIFELDGWNQLLIYFDRYSFQFCEKNRILFIFFPHGEYFPEKSKGKNPHGEGHNFPRGFVFPAGISKTPWGFGLLLLNIF